MIVAILLALLVISGALMLMEDAKGTEASSGTADNPLSSYSANAGQFANVDSPIYVLEGGSISISPGQYDGILWIVVSVSSPSHGLSVSNNALTGTLSGTGDITVTCRGAGVGDATGIIHSVSAPLPKYTVSFTIGDGYGSVSVPSISNVPSGTPITVSGNTITINGTTVTATPSSGYSFNNWTYNGGSVPATVTGDINIRANFTQIQTYTVSFTAGTGGTVNTQTISNVPHGSSISVSGNTVTINGTVVTATPTATYNFNNWTYNGGTVPATVTGNMTIMANFTEIPKYTVTLTSTTGGSVSPSQFSNISSGTTIMVSGNTISFGQLLTATATADTGYTFNGWTYNGGTVPSTVTGNMTIQANFSTQPRYTVTFMAGTGGSVNTQTITDILPNTAISVSDRTITINGTTVTATADTGYTFNNWTYNGGSVPATVTGNMTITATFTLNTYTVTFTAGTGGTVDVQSIPSVPYGTSISEYLNTITINSTTVTATPSSGYEFASWSCNGGSVPANVTGPLTFTANFNQQGLYTVTFTAGTGGTVSSPSISNITSGTTITVSDNRVQISGTTVTATASTGYKFYRWEYNGGDVPATVTSNIYIDAIFVPCGTAENPLSSWSGDADEFFIAYPVYVEVGGTVTITPYSGSPMRAPTDVTASYGLSITSGTLSGTLSRSGEIVVVITTQNSGSTQCTLYAVSNTTYTVSFQVITGGSVSQASISGIQAGTTITVSDNRVQISGTTVTATAETGYRFYKWTYNNGIVPSTVTGNMTITAVFTPCGTTENPLSSWSGDADEFKKAHPIYVEIGGAIDIVYYVDQNITLVISDVTPDFGLTVTQGNLTGTLTALGEVTVTLNQLNAGYTYCTIYSVGELTECTVLFEGTGGVIAPAILQNVPIGSTITVNNDRVVINGTTVRATADTGYRFYKWTYNGGSVPATVTGDMTITAVFTPCGTVSNPLNSWTGEADEFIVAQPIYVKTDGTVYVSTYDDGDTIITPTSVTSGYGLSISSGVLSGIISQEGAITVNLQRLGGQSITCLIYAVEQEIDAYTYWSNDEFNGSVSILYHMDSPARQSYTIIETMNLYKYNEGGTFTLTNNKIEIDAHNVISGGSYYVLISATYYNGDEIIASDTVNIGKWANFIVTVNPLENVITYTKVNNFASFQQYGTRETSKIIDLDTGMDSMTVYEIGFRYLNEAPRQQVVATKVFLNTYNVVMKDPTFDIDDYWPNQTNIRFALFSFALYGSTVTFNGYTFTVDKSKITFTYYVDKEKNYIYDPENPPNVEPVTKSLTLTNLYVTWQDGHCYLTFNDANGWTIDMGTYTNREISMEGIWYFQSGMYESYTETETSIVKDWTLFDFDFRVFGIIALGLLVLAGVVMRMMTDAKLGDYLILFGAIGVVITMIGGLL